MTRRAGPAPSPLASRLQALDAISGQLRAWDPELRPQFTQQWNVFAEYLIGQRSSINVGHVGNKSTQLVTPIDGNQPLPGTGDPSTWLPVQQRRPAYQFNPLITSISTTASRGAITTRCNRRSSSGCGMGWISSPITPWARRWPTTQGISATWAWRARARIR